MDACVETVRAMHGNSLCLIIANRRSRRRPRQVCKGSSCVLHIDQSTFFSRQRQLCI